MACVAQRLGDSRGSALTHGRCIQSSHSHQLTGGTSTGGVNEAVCLPGTRGAKPGAAGGVSWGAHWPREATAARLRPAPARAGEHSVQSVQAACGAVSSVLQHRIQAGLHQQCCLAASWRAWARWQLKRAGSNQQKVTPTISNLQPRRQARPCDAIVGGVQLRRPRGRARRRGQRGMPKWPQALPASVYTSCLAVIDTPKNKLRPKVIDKKGLVETNSAELPRWAHSTHLTL